MYRKSRAKFAQIALTLEILQTFEGIYAHNIGKNNRIRFPLDLVALFGQVSIWKSYFERCPIERHKWYLFTLAKVVMVKYSYVQMLKKCNRLFETNCPLNSLCALAMFVSYFCLSSEMVVSKLQKILQPKGKKSHLKMAIFCQIQFCKNRKRPPMATLK